VVFFANFEGLSLLFLIYCSLVFAVNDSTTTSRTQKPSGSSKMRLLRIHQTCLLISSIFIRLSAGQGAQSGVAGMPTPTYPRPTNFNGNSFCWQLGPAGSAEDIEGWNDWMYDYTVRTQYMGCYDMGVSSIGSASNIPNAGLSNLGSGANYYTFNFTNSGPYSSPFYRTYATFWTLGVSASNCTQNCQFHGFIYSVLMGQYNCQCGTYPPPGNPVNTNITDPLSPCHPQPKGVACLGDWGQIACGYYNATSGHYFADAFFDNTFNTTYFTVGQTVGNAITSQANITTLAASYQYIGCFSFNGLLLVPSGFVNQFTTINSCLDYCATFGFPLAALQYQRPTCANGET
jgi:hypothetical protein